MILMEGELITQIIHFLYVNKFNVLYKYSIRRVSSWRTFSSKKDPKSGSLMDAIIGDLLGDGHIRHNNKNTNKDTPNLKIGNARMEFTFSIDNLPYLRYLKFVAYSEICTKTEPTP
jgi:hypothetical protein